MSQPINNVQIRTNNYSPEIEFDHFLSDPEVRRATVHKGKALLLYPVENGPTEALSAWIATLTMVYVREIGSVSKPLVEKVWDWKNGSTNIDLRVGVHGGYRKLKVTTEMSGPQTVRLKITSWNKQGEPGRVWERFGFFYGNKASMGVRTLQMR